MEGEKRVQEAWDKALLQVSQATERRAERGRRAGAAQGSRSVKPDLFHHPSESGVHSQESKS